jgi:hypothetical protein
MMIKNCELEKKWYQLTDKSRSRASVEYISYISESVCLHHYGPNSSQNAETHAHRCVSNCINITRLQGWMCSWEREGRRYTKKSTQK